MEAVLIHADTGRSASLRHEVPLAIIDPFTYLEVGGRRVVAISVLEADRVAEVAPDIEIIDPYQLGMDEMIAQGMRWDESEVELALPAPAPVEGQREGAGRVNPVSDHDA